MTILHVRMDSRLIHGQILVAWNAAFNIDHIIAANDEVARDPLQVMLLEAVAPLGVKVSVLTTAECAAYCASDQATDEGIFIIIKTAEDGLSLVRAGLQVSAMNLGNQGFVQGAVKLGSSDSVYLTEPDVQALKALHDMGIRITCRMMPDAPDRDIWPIIEKSMPAWV
jgi:mannose/fructose/N-acetylgalactosamine-specific phosphotransferase system component IIB